MTSTCSEKQIKLIQFANYDVPKLQIDMFQPLCGPSLPLLLGVVLHVLLQGVQLPSAPLLWRPQRSWHVWWLKSIQYSKVVENTESKNTFNRESKMVLFRRSAKNALQLYFFFVLLQYSRWGYVVNFMSMSSSFSSSILLLPSASFNLGGICGGLYAVPLTECRTLDFLLNLLGSVAPWSMSDNVLE